MSWHPPPPREFRDNFSKATAWSPLENKCSKSVADRPIGLVSSKEFAVEGLKNLISLEKIKSLEPRKKSAHEDRCGSWAATSEGNKPPTPCGMYLTGSPWLARSYGYGGHRKGIGRLLDRTVRRHRAAL
jgi:hypothetical protein